MKLLATLASLSFLSSTALSAIVKPTPGYITKPESKFDFQLGPEILPAIYYVIRVDVGLEPVQTSSTIPNVINLATLIPSTGLSKTITLPASATTGVYNLVAIEHIGLLNADKVETGGYWKIFNQTFIVDCPGVYTCY